jgi:hypothetical protein
MNIEDLILIGLFLLVLGTISSIVLGSLLHLPILLEVGKILLWTSLGASLIPLVIVIIYGIYLRVSDKTRE